MPRKSRTSLIVAVLVVGLLSLSFASGAPAAHAQPQRPSCSASVQFVNLPTYIQTSTPGEHNTYPITVNWACANPYSTDISMWEAEYWPGPSYYEATWDYPGGCYFCSQGSITWNMSYIGPDNTWDNNTIYLHALLRDNGGNLLASADSPPITVALCIGPPTFC